MIMRIWIALVLTAGLFAAEAPASATRGDAGRSLTALREMDERVLTIGHRIAVANADLCPDRGVATGIVLHAPSLYGPEHRAAASEAFGLGDGPSVLALADGGAAQKGGLRRDDQLVRIGGVAFAADTPGRASSYAATAASTVMLEKAMGVGPVTVDVLRQGVPMSFTIVPEQGCPSRFQVVPAGRFSGKADGNYVQLTSKLVERVTDDAELAAVLAHELAHNILRHRERLNEQRVSRGLLKYFGKNASRIKRTEIEADQLSVYLLDRAGYPPQAAEAFWRRFGPQHPWGPFGSPTHPGWRTRADLLAEEVADLRRQAAVGGSGRPLPEFMR